MKANEKKYYDALVKMHTVITRKGQFSMNKLIRDYSLLDDFRVVVKRLGIVRSFNRKGKWHWHWIASNPNERMAKVVWQQISYNVWGKGEPYLGTFEIPKPNPPKVNKRKKWPKHMFYQILLCVFVILVLILCAINLYFVYS